MAKRKSSAATKKIASIHSSYHVTLRDSDVVLGRGSGVAQHPGNRRFRYSICLYKPIYAESGRMHKMNIARKVVEELETADPPARFVEATGDQRHYVVVCRRRAIEKTAQALRERKWNVQDIATYTNPLDPAESKRVAKATKGKGKKSPDRQQSSEQENSRLGKLSLKIKIKVEAKHSQAAQATESPKKRLKIQPLTGKTKIVKGASAPLKDNPTLVKVEISTPTNECIATPPEGVTAIKKRKASSRKAKAKARKGMASATKYKTIARAEAIPLMTSSAVPKVTPPSTPTNEEEDVDMFAGFGTWLPVKRRLLLNDDENARNGTQQPEIPLLARCSSLAPEATIEAFFYLDEKEDDIHPLLKEESIVPLEMVDFVRGMSTGYDTIIPDDQSVEQLEDEELFPFDFSCEGVNESEVVTSNMATHFFVSNGFV